MAADAFVLGHVSGIFGVRGELRLMLHNPDSRWLFEQPREVVLRAPDGRTRPARIQARPGAGRRVLGRMDGLHDREQARALMEWEILAPREAMPEPDEGSWYVEDLMGLELRTDAGRVLGTIAEVHQQAPVEVWEVHGPAGLFYVPVLLENILEVGAEGVVVRDEGVVEGV